MAFRSLRVIFDTSFQGSQRVILRVLRFLHRHQALGFYGCPYGEEANQRLCHRKLIYVLRDFRRISK